MISICIHMILNFYLFSLLCAFLGSFNVGVESNFARIRGIEVFFFHEIFS